MTTSRGMRLMSPSRMIGVLLLFGISSWSHALSIGDPAPVFLLEDQFGNDVALDDFRGRGVILDFCTIWCGSCQNFYETVFDQLEGQDLVVPIVLQNQNFAPSEQRDAEAWANAYDLGQTLHVGGDLGTEQTLAQQYNISAVPTFVFIDANLDVVGIIEGSPSDPARWDPLAGIVMGSVTTVPVPASIWYFLTLMPFVLPKLLRKS